MWYCAALDALEVESVVMSGIAQLHQEDIAVHAPAIGLHVRAADQGRRKRPQPGFAVLLVGLGVQVVVGDGMIVQLGPTGVRPGPVVALVAAGQVHGQGQTQGEEVYVQIIGVDVAAANSQPQEQGRFLCGIGFLGAHFHHGGPGTRQHARDIVHVRIACGFGCLGHLGPSVAAEVPEYPRRTRVVAEREGFAECLGVPCGPGFSQVPAMGAAAGVAHHHGEPASHKHVDEEIGLRRGLWGTSPRWKGPTWGSGPFS